MDVKPIPIKFLKDSVTLIEPVLGGRISTEVSRVRVTTEEVTQERSDRGVHTEHRLTMYYDCAQSEPSTARFACGMELEYDGRRYEITKVQEFGLFCSHHFRIEGVCRHIGEV